MAGVNAKKVLVGAPEQSGVSGAINQAPLGTAVPTNAREALDVAFKSAGYVSPDGVTVAPNLSTSQITDWNGEVIRTILESFTGTVNFQLIQFDADGARMVFGDKNVTVTAATDTTGEQIAVALGAQLPDPKSWVFRMKDGDALIRIVLPNAQVTEWAEMAFTKTAAIPLPATLTCNSDSNGKSIYIYTDDGVFSK